ncbi:hypothetical protein CRG98_003784 [Punica granatum]|uniref:Uncharacterized protein n=1 Tax=Punica granatum TaxID=22663 RepID=A0A2I0L571_PUNGR|nr:hypothetical protein CRG98_003784 [Punica granatum]
MLLNAPGACLRKLKVGGRSRKLHGALVACLGEFVAEGGVRLCQLLLVLVEDFPAKMISLGSEASELGLDGCVWGEGCPRCLEVPFLMGRMLGEIQTLNAHGSPHSQDLFDATLVIYGYLVFPPSVFKSNTLRILEDRLQATELPHYLHRKISDGRYMTHKWDPIKLGHLMAMGPGSIHTARDLKPLGGIS